MLSPRSRRCSSAHEVDPRLRHAAHVRDLVVLHLHAAAECPHFPPARVLADRAPPLRSPSTSLGSSPGNRRQHRQLIGGADRVLKVGGLAIDPDFARTQHVREARAVTPAGGGENITDRPPGSSSRPVPAASRAAAKSRTTAIGPSVLSALPSVGMSARRIPILVLRHGQSEWNSVRRWQGTADSPLTELGRQQAGATAAAGRTPARVPGHLDERSAPGVGDGRDHRPQAGPRRADRRPSAA